MVLSLKNIISPLSYYFIQPALLLSGLVIWYLLGYTAYTAIAALVFTQVVLRVFEYTLPAKPEWKQSWLEIMSLLFISCVGFALFYVVEYIYQGILVEHLISLKLALAINFWPSSWPLIVQIALFYFLNEFILYWLHRGFHSFKWFWRLSGHGFHHAFKNLHALNFLSSHPIEIFFLAIPALLCHYLLGVPPEVLYGGGILLLVNSSIVHANIKTNSLLIGWFITTSEQHRLHHSIIYKDSNTNFSCNAILWDRVFATYKNGEVPETGICKRDLSLKEKLLLPLKEPRDIQTSPR